MGVDPFRENQIPMAKSLQPARATNTAKSVRLNQSQRALILKALADPRRFELLQQIAKAGCPLGCSQALAALPISAATLSHHIKELETAGLIEVRREGKFAYLSLRPGVLGSLAAGLTALEPASCPGN
jgi:ArsR family transcriptional regulator